MTLEEFVAQLQSACGETLRSVVLYGSAVAGEHIQKRSDYNVLVIVDHFPLDRVRPLAAATRAWRDGGNPPPMIFTVREWRNSSDIFPMEYADILARHRVLLGEDPFVGISVDRDDLRLQTEHEALGVLFRLRQGVLVADGDHKAQRELLSGSLSSLMIVFRAVVRLHGGAPPQNYAELAQQTAGYAGFDPALLIEVVHHVRGELPLPKERVGVALKGVLAAMEQVVTHVDTFPHATHSGGTNHVDAS